MAIKINGAWGDKIKKYNVIVDPTQNYIVIPVVPGTDLDAVEVTFDVAEHVTWEKKGHVEKNNMVKYLFTEGSETQEWTVAF